MVLTYLLGELLLIDLVFVRIQKSNSLWQSFDKLQARNNLAAQFTLDSLINIF